MITAHIKRTFDARPRVSLAFWAAFAFVYMVGTLAVLAIVLVDLDAVFDGQTYSEGLTFKLSSIRVSVIVCAMITFLILFWTKIKTATYFLKIFTAWAVCMYIDDYLVLYDIVQYPDMGLVKVVFALRPFVITALAWMCLELDFRVKNGY